jgi:hypothetical protein
MKKIKNKILFLLAVILLIPFVASADAVVDVIDNIKSWIYDVSVALAVLMYLVAGFLWMSDAGSVERVKLAKNIMISTTIGLLIVLMAGAIANIVAGFK